MGAKRKKVGRRPIIDSAAKVAMLAALREGRRLDEVAAGYGVTLQAFYSARRRDPLFAAAWRDAHSLWAEAERRPVEAGAGAETGAGGEVRIASNNRRAMQRRRMRNVRFDSARKAVFLAAFERSCDLLEAAAAAGVCERTVYNHLRSDPEFERAFQAALESGYRWLETETVRLRLEAQARLRSAIAVAESAGEPIPLAEEGLEFDRAMKLLARWDRGGGRLGPRQVGQGRQKRWSFEEAIALLDAKLVNLGLRRGAAPPAGAG
ncbi:MAG TPA: hypothetical protein VF548_15460 [Allosphingosinicella sp.]|jgi:hypothetical protein